MDHLDTIHPNQCGIVCPICDKELPSKRRLKIHVVIHSDKKATCPVRIFVMVSFTTDKLRRKTNKHLFSFSTAKGQLISKCPYEKSVWTKYQRKY